VAHPAPAIGIPCEAPDSHPPSPIYSDCEEGNDGGASRLEEIEKVNGSDRRPSTEEAWGSLPVSNLAESFVQASAPENPIPSSSTASATPHQPQADPPPAAAAAQQPTQSPSLDISDDDVRNLNYPKNAEEALDRVHAMKDWLK
jgi:hypothetical protein